MTWCRSVFNLLPLHPATELTWEQSNQFSLVQAFRKSYLSAIGCFGLQVAECDQFPQQTTFLIASLHASELKICLWLEEDESQVDGEARHVDGERSMGVEHRLPAVDLSSCVDLGGLVPQAAHEGHGPHWNFPGWSHLVSAEGRREMREARGKISQVEEKKKVYMTVRHCQASAATAWTQAS